MKSQLFKLYNVSEFSDMHMKLEPLILEWLKRWLNVNDFELSFEKACYIKNFKEINLDEINSHGISIAIMNSVDSYIKLLFGVSDIKITTCPEVNKVVLSSLKSLSENIAGKTGVEAIDIFNTDEISKLGSGWIVVNLQFNEITIRLIYKPTMSELTDSTAVINNQDYIKILIQSEKVAIDVFLEGSDISAGDLDVLQIGDVLQLKHKINEPLRIVTPDKKIIGFCELGKINEFYAINVTKQLI